MNCKYCSKPCHRSGKQSNGTQKYRCKSCLKYQQATYRNQAYHSYINDQIVSMVKEGVGIRGIGRLLSISKNTVLVRIKLIAKSVKKPRILCTDSIYEIDEMWTFVGSKKNQQWITYIYDRTSKWVVDFKVGRRSGEFLSPMISGVLIYKPKFIATDGLMVYKSIIPSNLHVRDAFQTLRIERNNLNLRTHLKRLSRKTINYSKSVVMLIAVLKLYFWT
ncbi:IS1 family transposase [Roseivirga sp.]|uniref:IS1 family transposase n=1 Tax=Roseivirga sp. TaxID=1964215 RepID=UPI003B8CF050